MSKEVYASDTILKDNLLFYASDLLSIGAPCNSEEKLQGRIIIVLTMCINLAVFIVSFELQDVAVSSSVTAGLFHH